MVAVITVGSRHRAQKSVRTRLEPSNGERNDETEKQNRDRVAKACPRERRGARNALRRALNLKNHQDSRTQNSLDVVYYDTNHSVKGCRTVCNDANRKR